MTDTFQPPARAWQRMLSGRRLDLLNPAPDDILIEDIAHGLARVARWNGQTRGEHALSVAQHCLMVADVVALRVSQAKRNLMLAALLHDAAEYVIGDLISPFKSALGVDYKTFEHRLLKAIFERFGIAPLSETEQVLIKQADQFVAYFEATELAGFEKAEADRFFGKPNDADPASAILKNMAPWPAERAQKRFLERFHELGV